MLIDPHTEFGTRVERRLREEEVIWLVTVDDTGVAHPSPVWFWWDGAALIIFSQPNKPKLRNIAANPHVTLHFNSRNGGDIVVVYGAAQVSSDVPSIAELQAYVEKYRAGIARIGLTPETMARSYSVPILVRPTKVRGF